MGNLIESFNLSIDAWTAAFSGLFEEVPGAVFAFLIPIGLVHIFFGLRIYKIILVLICFVVGAIGAYHITANYVAAGIIGAGLAILAMILEYVFMIIVAGITFGTIAFAVMALYFNGLISILAAIVLMVLGIVAAVKIFKFVVIVTTSAIGSAAVVFSFLVLKEQESLFRNIDLTKLNLDKFQMIVGFCSLLILGILIQSISWSKSKGDA